MPIPAKLVYIMSLRNAAADRAGQFIPYGSGQRYMMSPLEFLVGALNNTPLGESYSLEAVIIDDDPDSPADCRKVEGYGFVPHAQGGWIYPANLVVQGRPVDRLLCSVPSTYRRLALNDPARVAGKRDFEQRLRARLDDAEADLVVLDGLLVILSDLVQPHSAYFRRIVNIHPGITRLDSPYERRGAYATLDALHGARGERVVNWQTMEKVQQAPVLKTGASFHYVDHGIDSGEVILDVLGTDIAPEDTILELRWNNFHNSLFPALQQGLQRMAELRTLEAAVS
ncbi:MAG: formyltransferase family protein [Acidovorax sp.]